MSSRWSVSSSDQGALVSNTTGRDAPCESAEQNQKVLLSRLQVKDLEADLWSRLCTCVISPDGDQRGISVHIILGRIPGKKEKTYLKSGSRNKRLNAAQIKTGNTF